MNFCYPNSARIVLKSQLKNAENYSVDLFETYGLNWVNILQNTNAQCY